MNSTVSSRSIAFPALDSITSGRPQVVNRLETTGAITRVSSNSITGQIAEAPIRYRKIAEILLGTPMVTGSPKTGSIVEE